MRGTVAQADRSASTRAGVPSPHDSLFREVFGVSANAAPLLRSVLPTRLAERFDLDRLALCSGSFVDKGLRWQHTDLLFTAPVIDQDLFAYFLIEHQSRTDRRMAFRFPDYALRIWDRYMTENHEPMEAPAVMPVVVHHGKRPWYAPTDLTAAIKLDDLTTRAADSLIPRWQYVLADLTVIDEATLRTWPLTSQAMLALLLLKSVADNPRLVEDLRRWTGYFNDVLNGPNGEQCLIAFLKYIWIVGEAPSDELHHLFAELGPEAKEAYVTTAEQLRAEGRVEGRVEGEAKGQTLMLVRLLNQKFGPLSPTVLDLVHTASVDQIEIWSDRLLTADTLDDVLR